MPACSVAPKGIQDSDRTQRCLRSFPSTVMPPKRGVIQPKTTKDIEYTNLAAIKEPTIKIDKPTTRRLDSTQVKYCSVFACACFI